MIEQLLSNWQVPQMYKLADCFVLPSHGEGWGLPYAESMAMGLPTIGTNWSGNTAFMNQFNSYLIQVESLVPSAVTDKDREHFWAQADISHLRSLMRQVYSDPQAAKEVGNRARLHMQQFHFIDQARALAERIRDLELNKDQKKAESKAREERYKPPPPPPTPKYPAGRTKGPIAPESVEIQGKVFYKMSLLA